MVDLYQMDFISGLVIKEFIISGPQSHTLNISMLILYKEKFEENVLRTNSCWFWQGRKTRERNGKEKGVIVIKKKSRAATKVSWELYRGKIPESMQIRQICKQDLCVNPLHLELIKSAYGRM